MMITSVMSLDSGEAHPPAALPPRQVIAIQPSPPRFTDTSGMSTIEFQLSRDYVELNQLLKLVGMCDSGGMGKAIVASGAVTVDGAVELRKTCKIRTGQVVRIGDVEVRVMSSQEIPEENVP
jgi:ribosome-associated protein